MAFKKPLLLAPAMNCNMWDNPALQNNLSILALRGINLIEPDSGFLACGYEGKGRMAQPLTIAEKAKELLTETLFLKGKKILITAGGTKEEIDPVRYIGNYSSGKMGIALADAAFNYGADVVLISTVKANKPYKVIPVKSAQDMLEETKSNFTDSDVLIMAAAVADYRPILQAEHKIKKENSENLVLELVKNPDILKEISNEKKPDQIVVGFCAESENLIQNAQKKLDRKKLDFIIANDISNPNIGFNSDHNAVSIISSNKSIFTPPQMPKTELAKIILKRLFEDEN